jgi:F-type H+-transporting ATPase subunit epsilon
MQLEIVTPAGQKLTEEVLAVTVPGAAGELGILPGHVPVLTVLGTGKLTFTPTSGGSMVMAINGGFLEVEGSRLILITETAEYATEIDVERARTSLDTAEKALAAMEDGDSSLASALKKKKRAEVRLSIVG